MSEPRPSSDTAVSPARIREVFWAFLALGLTSFGGPVAHLGYFRTEFVARRQWLCAWFWGKLMILRAIEDVLP